MREGAGESRRGMAINTTECPSPSETVSAQTIVLTCAALTSVLLAAAILVVAISALVRRCRRQQTPRGDEQLPIECSVYLVQNNGVDDDDIPPGFLGRPAGYEDMSPHSFPLDEIYESID
ncbi:m135 protein [Murid betaherpesvirus 1]|uniref:M135 protein n=7 Tax=Muromegalovirus muridbeta1 TaxID=3050323 RepID=H2A122_MUHV1|nr:m135 protein [Murid betaherpesvirus 1]